MIMHCWGDGFDFNGLEKAAARMAAVYNRITGKYMAYKEKYGTIRYEFTFAWLETKEECELFIRLLKWIVKKHPKFAGELVDDAAWLFADEKTNEFFSGIVYLHNCLNLRGISL